MKSTYSLDIILNSTCKNDEQRQVVEQAFKHALDIYQWYYQNADSRPYRDVEKPIVKYTKKVVQRLREIGNQTLADEVEYVLYNDDKTSILTTKKILSQAKDSMKNELLAKENMQENMKTLEKEFKEGKRTKEEIETARNKFKSNLKLLPDHGITKSVFNNEFAKILGDAFVEWCEEHHLNEAPDHYNFGFEPSL